MRGRFGEVLTAMVTPFDDEGKVDLAEAQSIAAWLVENGSDGLVVTGSTGESPTLSDDEKVSLYRAVVEAVGSKAKVIAGTGTYDTAHTIHLSSLAQKAGVHGLLVVTPYYNRPPQSGLLAHFKVVAGSTDLPVILYDIPIRTSRKIEHETLLELASVPNIIGVKDACSDVQAIARLIAESPPDFQVYSGNDGDTLAWLSVGAVGVIAVASHVVGLQMSEMVALFKAGDAEAAKKIHLDLVPVFDVMSITTNPIPVKAAMQMMGHKVGSPRLPLVPATEAEWGKIHEVLSRAGVEMRHGV